MLPAKKSKPNKPVSSKVASSSKDKDKVSSSSSKEKVPGSSKEKSKSKKMHAPAPKLLELENQFIMRLPEPFSTGVHEALGNNSLKDRLKIEFDPINIRKAQIQFDETKLKAKLNDLPAICESWKTFDKKSLWKTGDVGQMLIVKDPDEPPSSSEDEETIVTDFFNKQQLQHKKYLYPHGITPPLKNVRKRRFRKTARKKYVDPPEVEAEVKRLLRSDISAIDVTFEIQNDELEKEKQLEEQIEREQNEANSDIDVGGPTNDNFNENSNMSIFSHDGDTGAAADILPDMSSSEDEFEDNSNLPSSSSGATSLHHSTSHKPVSRAGTPSTKPQLTTSKSSANTAGSSKKPAQAGGSSGDKSTTTAQKSSSAPQLKTPSSSSQQQKSPQPPATSMSSALKQVQLRDVKEKQQACLEKLDDIQDKKQEQELRIERASNPLLKQRFQSGLDDLLKQEEKIKGELDKYETVLLEMEDNS